PYEGGSPASIMMRHVYDPPPALRRANPTIPVAAERVLARAMAKAPADRFQTMDEFGQALSDLRDAAGAETMVWSALPGGAGTRRRGDAETRRRADAETRRRGDTGELGRPGAQARPRYDGRTVVMPPAGGRTAV